VFPHGFERGTGALGDRRRQVWDRPLHDFPVDVGVLEGHVDPVGGEDRGDGRRQGHLAGAASEVDDQFPLRRTEDVGAGSHRVDEVRRVAVGHRKNATWR